ncbi:hypothetical protein INS49_008373 [Diaporthe citri]|uniref:uncharacterized protein n=1 Tax=Diaporthe citri TaxID=83186 RepID=UPI001C7FDD52|nr:uncharacterized protein INS49_008373 [Diaporthe citri]KAG6363276.1 hypothetical protein INS49_008373 [Diaporthe citri]
MAAPTNLVHLVVCRLCDSEVTVWDDVLNTALNVSLRPIEYRIMRTISNMGDHAIIYGDLSDVMDGNNAPGLEQEDDQLHPQAPLRDQAVGGRHGQEQEYVNRQQSASPAAQRDTTPQETPTKTKPASKNPLDKLSNSRSSSRRYQGASTYSPFQAQGVPFQQSQTIQQPGVPMGGPVNQNLSAWNQKDLEMISAALKTRLNVTSAGDTSIKDPYRRYLDDDDSGTTVAKPSAYLGIIKTVEYAIGLGTAKGDQKTGRSRLYFDVVMTGADKNWLLNQWTSMDVVIEGVPHARVEPREPGSTLSVVLDQVLGHVRA